MLIYFSTVPPLPPTQDSEKECNPKDTAAGADQHSTSCPGQGEVLVGKQTSLASLEDKAAKVCLSVNNNDSLGVDGVPSTKIMIE